MKRTPKRFKYSKPYSNRCFSPAFDMPLRPGVLAPQNDPPLHPRSPPSPWHGACNHPESLFGCLRSHKAGKWIVRPRKGKMKEKENEITDLADCTNHAYHVLWLARRIQHLWITAAIIVRECTGRGVEVEKEWGRVQACRLAGWRLPLWNTRARVCAPG